MDRSPAGHEIEYLTGNGEKILDRGRDIRRLGRQMISSAELLKSIADGASGQRGLAVEELQDVVGDCHEELKLAGERYKPSGDALVAYGKAVVELKPLIKTAVDNCKEEWEVVVTKRSAVSSVPLVTFPTAPAASTEPTDLADLLEQRQEAVKAAQDEADRAHDAWEAEARIFDTHYESWETAFELAAEGLDEATKGGIKDSRWDDLDGFVAGALEVLKWVGLGLAILGVLVGGPFIAALGAIAAIATLLLTAYAFARGNASGLDLALAVVGVIPFGSLGKLFNGNKLSFFDDMAGGLLTSGSRAKIAGEFSTLFGNMGRKGSGLSGVLGGLKNGFGAWATSNGTGVNIISRLFTGRNMADFSDEGLDGLSIVGGVWGDGHFKNLFGIPDGIAELFTGESLFDRAG